VTAFGPARTLPYDDALRADLRGLLDRADGLDQADPALLSATARLTERHADAVAALATPADIVGFHGQTILHRPDRRRTWQIGDAALLARRTGLPVAHDFRVADVAAGGEGAPLAPVMHDVLSRDLERPIAVLNIGGVANVTWIGGDGALLAFDTGPGNALLDDWTAKNTGAAFDRDGKLAGSGRPDQTVLGRLLADPYFDRPPPKSLDRLQFVRAVAASGIAGLTPADGAATLVAFTAGAVLRAADLLPLPPRRWLVTGGGRHNPAIMRALARALSGSVEPVESVGWNGDALEAQCFALLAVRVARRMPLTFPGTTGAPRPLSGGAIIRP